MVDLSTELLMLIILSYLIGSISPSLIIGKMFFHTDIREEGSKNLGGSNAGRILGKKIGILVIVLDFMKGTLSVWITSIVSNNNWDYIILSGLFVILGHLFPLFAKFRGGKGVATTGGVLLFINPVLLIISLFVLFLFWIITKYESLSTLIAFTFLFVIILINSKTIIDVIGLLIYIGILYAHRLNIVTLIQKKEKKKNLFSKFE